MKGARKKRVSSAVSRAVALANRRLTRREVELALAVPIGKDEYRDKLRLIQWFVRRYPTPMERLAYVRRAHARWRALF